MPPTHWRNILHHGEEPDEAMQRIDARVAPLEELPDAVRHIRALIARFDSLTHKKLRETAVFKRRRDRSCLSDGP